MCQVRTHHHRTGKERPWHYPLALGLSPPPDRLYYSEPPSRPGVRVITRTVDGAERTLYTFMLVLEETQGSGITLTQSD
jgi:hypothetical protein